MTDEKRGVAQMIAESSFTLWKSKEFRDLINFDKIDQIEQDRIFNELEVTALGLLALYCEEFNKNKISNEIIENFLDFLKKSGVDEKYIKIWRDLIAIRFDEYRKDYKIALKASKSWDDFKSDDMLHITWARIETLSIDGMSHIRRGKMEEKDPLWELLRKWLTVLDVSFSKLLNLPHLQKNSKDKVN